jgi:hypothetical protein
VSRSLSVYIVLMAWAGVAALLCAADGGPMIGGIAAAVLGILLMAVYCYLEGIIPFSWRNRLHARSDIRP